MGYSICQVDSNFEIKKENIDSAIKAAINISQKNYAWTLKKEDFTNPKKVFQVWQWDLSFDDNGNISGISFAGDKLVNELFFLEIIAPFVTEGSFIEILGEDGERWRWVFKDAKCITVEAIIIWNY